MLHSALGYLFATLVGLAGGSESQASAEDSISFAAALAGERGESEREFAFTQVQARLPFPDGPPIETNADAMRDQCHKLIRINGAEELYDLLADPLETRNLLAGETDGETKAAYARLSEQIDSLLGSETG